MIKNQPLDFLKRLFFLETMNYKKLIFTTFFIAAQITFAQTFKLDGQILDASNKSALPFANITLEGTTLGSASDSDGRFSKWIKDRGQGGLHHICYVVKNLDVSIELMKKNGAKLRECKACKVVGNHPHPEGFIAFLDNEVDNIEVELMQVYTEDELEKYKSYQGI